MTRKKAIEFFKFLGDPRPGVEAGKGDNYITGIIVGFDGPYIAIVEWDNGAITSFPISKLRPKK